MNKLLMIMNIKHIYINLIKKLMCGHILIFQKFKVYLLMKNFTLTMNKYKYYRSFYKNIIINILIYIQDVFNMILQHGLLEDYQQNKKDNNL